MHPNTHIRDNAVALRHDVTRGGGATVADLGQVFGVPEEQLALFGRAVRGERETLLDLMGPSPIDDAGTDRFIETLWQAIASNDELARAVAATKAEKHQSRERSMVGVKGGTPLRVWAEPNVTFSRAT